MRLPCEQRKIPQRQFKKNTTPVELANKDRGMSETAIATEKQTDHETLQLNCMEVWGGFESTDKQFHATGLDISLKSRPCHGSENGGDVYYISSCASGRISRILLADVSGHGDEVANTSQILKNLVRKNINFISPKRLTRQLNQDFGSEKDARGFATALIATYYCPSQTLTMNIAGHPTPMVYRVATGRWEELIPLEEQQPKMTDLPLGVLNETNYQTTFTKLEAGDFVLCYTDGLIELKRPDGSFLGIGGVLAELNSLEFKDNENRLDAIIERIQHVVAGPLDADDLTLILMKANPPHVPLINSLLAPFRLVKGLFSPTE